MTKKKKRPVGRPRMPQYARKDCHVDVRMDIVMYDRLEIKATQKDETMGGYVRSLIADDIGL